MNIFKVLASSKKRFSEEQASVILAWLLNPEMDHGLDFVFLREFLAEVEPDILKDYDKSLQNILRSKRNSEKLNISVDIEFYVNSSFIDVVLFIGNYIIAIENKIYAESATNKNQLVSQYEGLKKQYGDEYKIRVVFLVPDAVHPYIVNEYETLKTKFPEADNEFTKIEWNVISKIIKNILKQDSVCEISPINDNLKYMLKELSFFIDDDFSGYSFEEKLYGGMNPLAKGMKKLNEIKDDSTVKYVGVKYGIIGLLTLTKDELENRSFQFTSEEIDSFTWLEKELFLNIGYSIINKNFNNLDWVNKTNGRFPYDIIYNIANNTKITFFIGIQGGEKALSSMENEKIVKKLWAISLKKENSQWIDKNEYIQILNNKGVFIN